MINKNNNKNKVRTDKRFSISLILTLAIFMVSGSAASMSYSATQTLPSCTDPTGQNLPCIMFISTLPLSVSASPNAIELGKPVQVTISANDRITHAPVEGKVMSNEFTRPAIGQEHQIGTTNTQFTHTFSQIRLGHAGRPPIGVAPTITVIAPGYDSTKVNINFTGLEPAEPPS